MAGKWIIGKEHLIYFWMKPKTCVWKSSLVIYKTLINVNVFALRLIAKFTIPILRYFTVVSSTLIKCWFRTNICIRNSRNTLNLLDVDKLKKKMKTMLIKDIKLLWFALFCINCRKFHNCLFKLQQKVLHSSLI